MDSLRRARIPLIAAVVVTTAGLLGAGTAVSVLATPRAGTSPPAATAPLTGDAPTAQPAPPRPPTHGPVLPVLELRGSGGSSSSDGHETPAAGTLLDVAAGGTYRLDYTVSAGCARHWWIIEVVSDGGVLHREGWFISNGTDPVSGSRTHNLAEGTYHVRVLSTLAADSADANPDCDWSYALFGPQR